ncbi:hypothetical protein BJX65DRAFT_311267 [Aspergillus insuetus]
MSPPPPSKHPEPCLNELELLDSLGVSAHCLSNDLRMVTRELHRIEIPAQTQAQQLFTSGQFAGWMAGGRSATLLGNANFDTPGFSRVTALSVLCAMFALRMSDRDNQCITLHMLCHTFSQLVEQLRGSVTIICILDGRDDFSDVLLILDCLATNPVLRFKLLCTTPFASCDRLIEQRLDVQYSLRLQPSAVSNEREFSQRSLPTAAASAGCFGYYRAQMQRNEEDQMDDSDANDNDSEVQYGTERKDERVYRFA